MSNIHSFYQRAVYTVNAKSWTTVNLPSPANYFHLVNMGAGTLYFSASRIPTDDSYDMKISAGGAKMHVEPSNRTQVYVYNGSAQAVNFALVYFAAEFDPLVLALTSLESTGGGGGSSSGGGATWDGIINGFDTALPSGNNTLGNVILVENNQLTQIVNALKGATPAGANKIGSVDIANSEQLSGILNALTTPEHGLFSSGNSTATGVTVAATSGRKITCITFLSNDGEADLSVTVGDATFTLKSGEVLDNFKVYVDSIKILGNSVPYRLAYNEREV